LLLKPALLAATATAAAAAATLGLALAGCPSERCAVGFIGDRGKPIELALVFTDGVAPDVSPLAPMQPLPLEPPPQGGYVMYAGARARNLDGCGVIVRGDYFDEFGNQAGMDERSTNLVVRADGWGWPDAQHLSEIPNLSACPDVSHLDIQGHPYNLRIRVTDRSGRMAEQMVPIVPTCMLSDAAVQADCICQCSADFTPGKCGTVSDGGGGG
jgi:hypothetical protein